MNKASTIVVIGAGVGGLAAACDLARAGHRVTVLERGPAVGGKMRRAYPGARPVDAGPTVLTMRSVFDELFADAGRSLDDALTLDPAHILARHAWADGARLDLFAEQDRSAAAIADLAGAAAAEGYRAFCRYAARIFEEVEAPFLRGPRPTPTTLLAARGLRVCTALRKIDAFSTLWGALGRFFPDPRLRQLFGRYATYAGSSPLEAPATLNLIAHVEQSGVWTVRGGMYRLAEALAMLATELGAELRCDSAVEALALDRGRVAAVRLASGERLPAAAVVCNADPGALAAGAFGDAARAAAPAAGPRSLSAITWAVEGVVSGFPLAFHNVFFSRDYPAEFAALFDRRQLPEEPTVYVCAQDRGGADAPPAGEPERLLVLVNAPADGDAGGPSPRALEDAGHAASNLLSRCGLRIERRAEIATGPAEFAQMFPGSGGALYGMATHGWRASLRRPDTRTRVPNLYLAGGAVHPGAGVPLVALSGRLAARQLIEGLGA